jgi:hypothetical protein
MGIGKQIRAVWNRMFESFEVERREPVVNNVYSHFAVHKISKRIVLDGVEYEWWVTANTPWNEPGFISIGVSPNYDIYRRLDYDKIENFNTIFADGSPVVEALADEVHQIWCNWMMYQFEQGWEADYHGAWTMNEHSYRRWQRLMKTPYAQLSEDEKQSDRKVAKRYLQVMLGVGDGQIESG